MDSVTSTLPSEAEILASLKRLVERGDVCEVGEATFQARHYDISKDEFEWRPYDRARQVDETVLHAMVERFRPIFWGRGAVIELDGRTHHRPERPFKPIVMALMALIAEHGLTTEEIGAVQSAFDKQWSGRKPLVTPEGVLPAYV